MDDDLDVVDVDVIVVGAGLAGLAAAQVAQRGGAKVVVLDGQSPGGRARSDERDGFVFNRGPHALYLGGPATDVLAELGVATPGGPPSNRAYGSRGDLIAPLPASAKSLATTKFLGLRGKAAIGKLLGTLPKLQPARFANQSVDEWLDGTRIPADARQIVEMLIRVSTYANAPATLSAQVAIMQVQMAFTNGVRYLDGGWQSLVDALADGLDIRHELAMAVNADGSEVTVTTARGALHANAVVVAVGTPAATAALLGRRPYDVGPPIEAACLDLGTTSPPEPPVLFGIDEPLYLSTHQPPARLAPDGRCLVHVARYLAAGDALAPDAQRAELVAHAARTGIATDAVVASRYLHRMTVVGAVPTAATGGLAGRPAMTDTGIEGVTIAGDWVGGVGHLADAALASGRDAAHRALARCAARA